VRYHRISTFLLIPLFSSSVSSALSAVKLFQKNTSKDARRAIAHNTQTNPPAQNRGGLFACRVIDGDALQIIKDSYRNAVKSERI